MSTSNYTDKHNITQHIIYIYIYIHYKLKMAHSLPPDEVGHVHDILRNHRTGSETYHVRLLHTRNATRVIELFRANFVWTTEKCVSRVLRSAGVQVLGLELRSGDSPNILAS